nr:copia protein [Tanacetum cinerariifolium]
MSRDVLTVGSTMRIPLLYQREYSQWVERFINYLEEQTDGEAMINSIKNDKSMWSDQEKKIQKIDHLARSLLIQGLPNDIYSLIDSNKTAKDLWDALAKHMLGSEYEWKQYATMMRQSKNLMDINIDALYNILKKNQGDVNDAMGLKKKIVVVTSDPLALIVEKTKVSKSKEKVVVSLDSEVSDADDFSELNKITTLLAKAFNQRKFYSKPTNNNLRTSSTSQSTNKKQKFVKTDDKKVEKKDDEKKRDMSKVKCYNCKKEGHFVKDCKKVKVKDYEYYKTKMLLAKKDKDEQVLLAEDQAWMESSSDSDQEINANMVFMAQIKKVLLDSKTSSSSADDKISEIVQIFLWIIDSGCSKHLTGNRALLTNFVEKFHGTVRFGNKYFAVIAGYGDVVIGSMTIKKVYYVEGFGHNLFSVGQICDKGLEVAFRKSTCFVRNEDSVDLLTGDRSSNLYTISLNEVASNSSTCFLEKASSLQSWLWHQRLSHINFATINNLVKNNLVQGLPKMKFEKDHLCSGCEQGKIHQKHHKSKTDFALNKPLYLLHMNLCRPMRVESINGKRYVLVVVDDYSR